MPARDVLHEVLGQAKISLYWQLLYDADSQTYYFNIEMAKRVQYALSHGDRGQAAHAQDRGCFP